MHNHIKNIHIVRVCTAIIATAIIALLVRSEVLATANMYFMPAIFLLIGGWSFLVWKMLGAFPATTKNQQKESVEASSFFSPKRQKIVAAFLLGTFLILGLVDIQKQSLVDEPLWIFDRVERYSHRIAEGNFELSRPSDKPGLTVSLLASAALLKYPTPSALEPTITPEIREELFLLMRTPIFVFVTFLIFLLYQSLRKLIGEDIALVTLGFITLSPVLLGMSRLINPDAILWVLLPLSICTFAQAVLRPSKQAVLYAGCVFGLALLTKYITNILLVFFPVMIALAGIYRWTTLGTDGARRDFLQRASHVFVLVLSIGVILYSALLPSTWVEPLDILKGTLLSQAFGSLALPWIILMLMLYIDLFAREKSLSLKALDLLQKNKTHIVALVAAAFLATIGFVFVSAYTGTLIDYYTALRSPKSVLANTNISTVYFTGFYVLIFGVGIPVLLGAMIGLFRLMMPSKVSSLKSHGEYLIVVAVLFILFYYLGHMVSGVTPTLRYQILVFPLLSIIAAFGMVSLMRAQSKRNAYFFVGATAVLLFVELMQVKPFYMSYANGFLPNGDILNIKDMGDGSYQAALYINNLPNASELEIWADKAGICAMTVARCTTTVDVQRIEKESLVFDYFVITKGREFLVSRDARQELRRKAAPAVSYDFESLYTAKVKPAHEIILGNNPSNYIRIYNQEAAQFATKQNQD